MFDLTYHRATADMIDEWYETSASPARNNPFLQNRAVALAKDCAGLIASGEEITPDMKRLVIAIMPALPLT